MEFAVPSVVAMQLVNHLPRNMVTLSDAAKWFVSMNVLVTRMQSFGTAALWDLSSTMVSILCLQCLHTRSVEVGSAQSMEPHSNSALVFSAEVRPVLMLIHASVSWFELGLSD
jgi:hypothetical protein